MKYPILLFDADNTLLDFSACEREALTNAFAEMGIALTAPLRARYLEINRNLWQMHERGEIERGTLLHRRFELLFAEAGIRMDGQAAEDIYRRRLDEGHQTLPGAVGLCRSLATRHALYIVTNGVTQTQERRLRESGLRPFFRDVFVSEALGAQKPDIRFFDAVKARIPDLGIQKALVIGDSPTSDILGGLRAGLDTCHFDPHNTGCPKEIRPTHTIQSLDELYAIVD